ncbi:MAG TPA: hypothetical protein VF588_19270 [Pyrinomonadaceae bacterium]|jgi:hypothetical protein
MKTTDTAVESDIITGSDRDIIERFGKRQDIRRIAEETGLEIEVVSQRLKPVLKKILAARIKNYGPEGHF